MKNKFAKWKPYIFLAVLLASLVPLVWLGRYNYPTGDDYYYGTEAYHRPFPPPVPVSPKAIRSGREPIQRCF